MAKRNLHGVVVDRIQPGAFYVASTFTWQDVTTQLVFAGARVRVDEKTRAIVEVVEVGEPIQVPTHRAVFISKGAARRERSAPVEKVREEIAFDAPSPDDGQRIVEALDLALSTATIRLVDEEEMFEHWPELWAARKERIVFDPRAAETAATPISDLIADFTAKQKAERERGAASRSAAGNAQKT